MNGNPSNLRKRVGARATPAFAVALLACGGGTKSFTPYVPPEVTSVAITPSGGVFGSGTALTLRADAWDPDGNYIWLEDRSDVSVEWSAEADSLAGTPTAAISFSNSTSNPTTLTVSGPLPPALVIAVTVDVGGVTTLGDEATFTPPITGPAGSDRVMVASAAGPVESLLDACERIGTTSQPVFGIVYGFVNGVALSENLTQQECEREAGYALLSPNFRMLLGDPDDLYTTPVWTNLLGDELNHGQPADWQPMDEIDLYLHFFVAEPKHAEAENLVNDANDLLRKNALGMQFTAISPAVDGPNEVYANCDTVRLSELLTKVGANISDTRLHVLFVNKIWDGVSAAANGKACPHDAGGRFILIDWRAYTGELLAHELGHVLGHEYPNLAVDHVVDSTHSGFDKSNLMHESTPGYARGWLSTGQVFRMNVDDGSWYQHDPAVVPKHPSKDCGDRLYDSPSCPSLDRRPGGIP